MFLLLIERELYICGKAIINVYGYFPSQKVKKILPTHLLLVSIYYIKKYVNIIT